MENFEQHTDPAIIPEENQEEFSELEKSAQLHASLAAEDREAAEESNKASQKHAKIALASASAGLAGGLAVGSVAGPAGFVPMAFGALGGAGFTVVSAIEGKRATEKEADAKHFEGKSQGEFAEARDLIDIEAARKVAEADGVDIVRPEDVKA